MEKWEDWCGNESLITWIEVVKIILENIADNYNESVFVMAGYFMFRHARIEVDFCFKS